LGRPVWVALSTASDWRWFRNRGDSPWYPSMRLFRQKTLGDWETVFAEMAQELESVIASPAPKLVGQTQTVKQPPGSVRVEIAPGELIDKITILEIKQEQITEADKLRNVRKELEILDECRRASLPLLPEVDHLTASLKEVNQQLWEIEDQIRDCERNSDFAEKFIGLARAVYQTNDRRAKLKREINELLGSRIVEEKSYASY